MGLYAVQTTKSHETTVADMITNRGIDDIHAALAPEQMVSYVIVESENPDIVERAIEEVPHARKVLKEKTSMAEVEGFLEPTSDVEGVNEGDIVELTSGPFQGEKAQIQKIDESNERVTVEMLEATVPIPVEVRGDQLRVLDSDERGED